MNQHLKTIQDFLQQNNDVAAEEKEALIKAIKKADNDLTISEFKLERTEKVKRTTAILLEETIEELEQKRKAVEAQNRELEIEASLEKVRLRTMAMRKSEELLDLITVVSEQLHLLNFRFDHVSFAINNEEQDYNFWVSIVGQPHPAQIHVPYLDNPMYERVREVQKNKLPFYADVLTQEENRHWHQHVFEHTELKFLSTEIKEHILNSGYARSIALMPSIMLVLGNYAAKPYSDDENKIFKRFAKVFEQTYTRFLDLQKAEAQSRESQIQLALERVRARTMAMQKSDELADASFLLDSQVRALGIKTRGCAFNIYGKNESTEWFSSEAGTMPVYKTPREKIFLRYYEAGQRGDSMYIEEFAGKACAAHYDYLCTLPVMGEALKKMKESGGSFPTRQIDHVTYFKYGYLLFITLEPVPEAHEIFKRFAKVFEQTYTRFLDLQKAETQALEAQIEAALERVRAKSMAMHKSVELPETAKVLFEQFDLLGKIPDRMSIGIINEETKKVELWVTDQSGNQLNNEYFFSLDEPTSITKIYAGWKEGKESIVIDLTGRNLEKWLQFVTENAKLPIDLTKIRGRRVQQAAFFSRGFLLLTTHVPVADEIMQLLIRFARVFNQTYTRFLDLQKAEAQAKDAIKQASLDRVRGEIASMRSTEDLQRITPLIFNELTTLGVPFIRCGVFIINETENIAHLYLSAPDGHSLAVLNFKFDSNELTKNAVDHWRKGKVYHQHWSKDDFINWAQSMVEEKQIENQETYQDAAAPPESLDLHFVPFTQGMLYVGNTAPLNEDEINLVKSLAEAFSIAYARYEDFTKLEQAKQSIETTLTELRSAQKQLIQSEKMASLGELTAGIAHEIQNPLNFVNNFSEVNTELLTELLGEIEKGNYGDAKELVNDIIENEQKINHHGKRADSIVKGMLQHSRKSDAVKELTDINKLADEYLRLCYHGLRAKDKDFNAKLQTDFDESTEKIEIIPQEIGRVLLNLYNNAFYAVNEKKNASKSSAGQPYEPKVTVSTKSVKSPSGDLGVELTVTDNGNGIPQKIIDKIFQPFFTTKPTGQGTGLGLSLSYDIVKAHGGEITVNSKDGEGTEFTIKLPHYLN